jgi:hypothetical protein
MEPYLGGRSNIARNAKPQLRSFGWALDLGSDTTLTGSLSQASLPWLMAMYTAETSSPPA